MFAGRVKVFSVRRRQLQEGKSTIAAAGITGHDPGSPVSSMN